MKFFDCFLKNRCLTLKILNMKKVMIGHQQLKDAHHAKVSAVTGANQMDTHLDFALDSWTWLALASKMGLSTTNHLSNPNGDCYYKMFYKNFHFYKLLQINCSELIWNKCRVFVAFKKMKPSKFNNNLTKFLGFKLGKLKCLVKNYWVLHWLITFLNV